MCVLDRLKVQRGCFYYLTIRIQHSQELSAVVCLFYLCHGNTLKLGRAVCGLRTVAYYSISLVMTLLLFHTAIAFTSI